MGKVEIISEKGLLVIQARLFFYGRAATDNLSRQIAEDIAFQDRK
ncbi:MAG: hypothetical protein SGI96_12525 [Bacteroidota bacterium]|nr:hypothetical protein [Bacteroidota bacterium]